MLRTVIGLKGTEHTIARDLPTTLIGERINPTNKRAFAEELEAGAFDTVRRLARAQKEAGAHILDVNVGTGTVDEVKVLPEAVRVAWEEAGLPVCIDSTNVAATEAALALFPGKALVNSVNGEEQSLSRLLPVVKRYGAAVVGLTMDEGGIPDSAERRLEIARKIVSRAEEAGIPREDVIIDPLTISAATDSSAGRVTLEAVRRISEELGVNVVLGASNVSFGLPERTVVNAAFLAMAIAAGMSAVITDVTNVNLRKAILASDVLVGRDDFAMRYLGHYRATQRG